MPAATESAIDELVGEASAPAAAADPSVLNVNLFDKAQRAVQYLQYAGLLSGDDSVTTLNLLKLVNHAAFADEAKGTIPALQEAFRLQMASGDVSALTEGGAQSPVMQLVDGVLAARIEHHQKVVAELDALPSDLSTDEFNRTRQRAEDKIARYEKDRAYYQEHPEVINSAVREHPEALTADKYLPIGRLAVETGMVKGDKAAAADMVDDVLANAAAHSLLHTAEAAMTTSDADLELNKRFPDRYRSNILAKATDIAATTTAIENVKHFDEATPELARIQALKSMLSAHLHAMTQHTRDADGNSNPPVEQLAEALTQVKPLVRDYQSAAMSLAYHFLGEGAGKDDPRMQALRHHLADMMEEKQIPLLMDRSEADRAATELAQQSAEYLRGRENRAIRSIDTLLARAMPAGKAAQFAPAASHAERTGRPEAGVGLGV